MYCVPTNRVFKNPMFTIRAPHMLSHNIHAESDPRRGGTAANLLYQTCAWKQYITIHMTLKYSTTMWQFGFLISSTFSLRQYKQSNDETSFVFLDHQEHKISQTSNYFHTQHNFVWGINVFPAHSLNSSWEKI